MGLTKVNKTDRSQYVWCYDHCDLIMPWWQNELAQNQHDCWGHPDTVKVTGQTHVASDTVTRPVEGTAVEITLPTFDGWERESAELALMVARSGTHYTGPGQPAWYSSEDVRELFARVQQSETMTVSRIIRDVFDLKLADDRIAASLTADEVAQLHRSLLATGRRVAPIGCIGNDGDEHYGKAEGVARIGDAAIPYCVLFRLLLQICGTGCLSA